MGPPGVVAAQGREVPRSAAGAVRVHRGAAVRVPHVEHVGADHDVHRVAVVDVVHHHGGGRQAAGLEREHGVHRRVRARGHRRRERRLVAGQVHRRDLVVVARELREPVVQEVGRAVGGHRGHLDEGPGGRGGAVDVVAHQSRVRHLRPGERDAARRADGQQRRSARPGTGCPASVAAARRTGPRPRAGAWRRCSSG